MEPALDEWQRLDLGIDLEVREAARDLIADEVLGYVLMQKFEEAL